jgi:hypothetical protein
MAWQYYTCLTGCTFLLLGRNRGSPQVIWRLAPLRVGLGGKQIRQGPEESK